ncbi:ribonuclease PH [Armatimonas sp.]|uniref:ribonuclease PH n=1 Tax=Armatimonas sp. TaxID=1872638 RepID=UPI00286CDD63|nr:ribonuclease PH [Armatimonas sp.]
MPRVDGRGNLDLRVVRIERGFMPNAEGSCLISMGSTKVICTATVEERVPMWMKGRGEGWVTAEYSMLPRSGKDRKPRESNKPDGRSVEIQRLIGRSLRSVVDMKALGERMITLDCDVIQADGGTRCASITGCYVALAEALHNLNLKKPALSDSIAAVSVGIVGGIELLDLCYEEDSRAMVDMDIVATGTGKYVEVRGTAEGRPYDRKQMDRLLDTANVGLETLFRKQRETLADII